MKQHRLLLAFLICPLVAMDDAKQENYIVVITDNNPQRESMTSSRDTSSEEETEKQNDYRLHNSPQTDDAARLLLPSISSGSIESCGCDSFDPVKVAKIEADIEQFESRIYNGEFFEVDFFHEAQQVLRHKKSELDLAKDPVLSFITDVAQLSKLKDSGTIDDDSSSSSGDSSSSDVDLQVATINKHTKLLRALGPVLTCLLNRCNILDDYLTTVNQHLDTLTREHNALKQQFYDFKKHINKKDKEKES